MIAAVILASGFSKRMGENKLLLPLDDKALIEHALDKIARCSFSNVILVSSHDDILKMGRDRNIIAIYNSNAEKGQSESIKLGILNSSECEGYMFFTGDQPLLDIDTINLLISSFENDKSKIVAPVCKGKRGNPVIFPSKFREEFLGLAGDTGGRIIINNHIEDALFVEVENEYEFWDVDTQEDYNKLVEIQKDVSVMESRICGKKVIVRGGGDIASGTIQKLFRSGFKVLVLETEAPTSIRRKVSFSETVYEGSFAVEGIKAKYVADIGGIEECWQREIIPVITDPKGEIIPHIKPLAVVDAILAKKNTGTRRSMAPVTIALGPGFEAGCDVDIVIETMRGHDLGRLIFQGKALDNTGIPGEINGYSIERVIYSPGDGVIENFRKIGDVVRIGDIVARVGNNEITAQIAGVLRGIIRNKSKVFKGSKIADIDPRISEKINCFTISEKARNIAGGVLEAILYMQNKNSLK